MELRLTKTLWGVDDLAFPDRWESLFQRIKDDGFQCLEGSLLCFELNKIDELGIKKFTELRKKHGLDFIAQVHTCGYPVSSRKVAAHVAHFRESVKRSKTLLEPSLINSHSGHDSWTLEESVSFFTEALKVEEEEGILIVHETHRRRVFYSPWATVPVLERLPKLSVTADLSHWVCVAERLFDDKLDDDWPGILQLIAKRCKLIHARVGYAEGPQVPDPRAPEYKAELHAHEKWWIAIWHAQAGIGTKIMYHEPEFGPPPYLHTLPHTQMPVSNLWDINTYIGKKSYTLYQQEFHHAQTKDLL